MNRDRIKQFALGLVFLALGLCVAVPATMGAFEAYQRRAAYRQVTCVLLEKRLTHPSQQQTKKKSTPPGMEKEERAADAPERLRGGPRAYEAWTKIQYSVDGMEREAAGDLFPPDEAMGRRSVGQALQSMKVGETYPAWVDPADPSKVLLSLGTDGPWSFTVMIGGGLLFAVVGLKFMFEAVRGKRLEPIALDDVPPI